MAAPVFNDRDALLANLRGAIRAMADMARRGLSDAQNPHEGHDALRSILREAERLERRLASPADPAATLPPLTVLVADDSLSSRTHLSRMLASAGHVAHEAQDGHDAIRALIGHDFDILLLDLRMPHMDGMQAARAIRASSTDRVDACIPIVGISAAGEHADVDRAMDAGMDSFTQKPARPERLFPAMAEALDRRGRLDALLDLRGPAQCTAPHKAPAPDHAPPAPAAATARLRSLATIQAEFMLEAADVDQLYADLLEDMPLQSEALRIASDEAMHADVEDLAHYMAGSALAVVATGPAELARRVEQAAAAHDETTYRPLVADLIAMVSNTLDAIQTPRP